MLDAFKLTSADGQTIEISNRRGRAILGMLCIVPGHSLQRETVSKLIWPGRFKPQARASLRQCLHELNRELQAGGLDILQTSNTHIALSSNAIRTDLSELESALLEQNVELASVILAQTMCQRILSDISLGAELESWLSVQRLHLENRLRLSANQCLADLTMTSQHAAHDKLAAAWQHWSGLGRLQGRIGLAILPFEQMDGAGGESFWPDGAAEELSSRLGSIESIALAGRTSVQMLQGQSLTLPEMAKALNVTHLIEGTVHRRSDGLALSIRLIDGSNGMQLWDDQVHTSEADLLSGRQVLGANVVAGLCKALDISPQSLPARRMTSRRDAYALYLQGLSLLQKTMVSGALEKAVELLQNALEIDPDFAECWTALAEAYISTIVYRPCVDKVERSAKAAECAERALAIDDKQGYAHAILSIHEWTCFNPSKSLEYALQAYRLEPSNADVTMRLGSCLLYLGRTREALPYIQAAIDQDPVNGRNYAMLCTAQLNLGNHPAALVAGQSMVDMGLPGFYLALTQAAMGDHDAAIETYYDIRRFVGTMIALPAGTPEVSDEARDAYLLTAAKGVCSGDPDSRDLYCNLIEMLHQTLPEPYDHSVAWPAIWMGHTDLVMKIYRECIHPANMPGLMHLWADIEPMNRTINHPQFMSFAEDIGLVQAWEKYGWPDLLPADPRTQP
ncbi:MAG: BTAD domain-containing putative transcriptional regulator [Woeseiaceae bacterium]